MTAVFATMVFASRETMIPRSQMLSDPTRADFYFQIFRETRRLRIFSHLPSPEDICPLKISILGKDRKPPRDLASRVRFA